MATERPTPDAATRFAQLVEPELAVLSRVAWSLTRSAPDAEDLVQDTLLRAYRGIDGFDGRHPRAWLLTIMRNAQVNRVRRRRPGLLDDPDATFERGLEDPELSGRPESVVVDPTFDAEVERALADLPGRFRRVVELVDIEGRSYAEAADALGVPVGTVMSRLHRARRRMRTQLESAGVTRRGGA